MKKKLIFLLIAILLGLSFSWLITSLNTKYEYLYISIGNISIGVLFGLLSKDKSS